MIKKECIKLFDSLLEDVLSPLNFLPYYTQDECGYILRKSNGDVHFLGLRYTQSWNTLTNKRDAFCVEPYLVVSVSEIEREYKKITKNIYYKYEIDYRTLTPVVASIIAFPSGVIKGIGHNEFGWRIEKKEDVIPVVNKLIVLFKDVILPYFKTNSNVKRVDELFNNNLDAAIIHVQGNPTRALRGLIAKYLLNSKDYDKIINHYDSSAGFWPSNLQEEYADVKKLFSTNTDFSRQ